MRQLKRRPSAADQGQGLMVELWRHHEAEMYSIPGMSMGMDRLGNDVVQECRELFARGVRLVSLKDAVDLRQPDAQAVQALAVLRELTSHGIVVNWSLTADPSLDIPGTLGHLYPPISLAGRPDHDEVLDVWRMRFYVGKCGYRHGPGFMQVRDRRSGVLQLFTIDDPGYLQTIARLIPGAPEGDLPEDIVGALEAETLTVRFGRHLWWAPYRIHRWPQPSMVV